MMMMNDFVQSTEEKAFSQALQALADAYSKKYTPENQLIIFDFVSAHFLGCILSINFMGVNKRQRLSILIDTFQKAQRDGVGLK